MKKIENWKADISLRRAPSTKSAITDRVTYS